MATLRGIEHLRRAGDILCEDPRPPADRLAALSGRGEVGVIVIDGTRQGYRGTIPVGTFTATDGRRTADVAWQTRQGEPVEVGDRRDGVRVGGRVWPPDAGFGAWDVVIVSTLGAVLLWRLLHLSRTVRGRREPAG